MNLEFSSAAWEDYLHWQDNDPATLLRVNLLLKETMRDPFRGIAKPEPLKGDLQGYWSRRINSADRMVYKVDGKSGHQKLVVIALRYHY